MASYLVLSLPGDENPEKLRFIRDGFSWLALIFGPFWLLANRAWLAGFITLVLSVALSIAGFDEGLAFASSAASLALNLFIALEGREWKARAMQKRGCRLEDVIVAPDIDTAEEIFFAGHGEITPLPEFRAGSVDKGHPATSGIGLMDAYSEK